MGTDGSVHACAAILTASRLLQTRNTNIEIVTVSPESPVPAPRLDKQVQLQYEKHVTSRTRKILQAAQRILARLHRGAHAFFEFGSPADRLLALAPDYSLLVVGAYGEHERKQPGLGPVASRLLQQGKGNLLIGRELVNENNYRVLAALDSSEASFTALQALASLFDRTSLEVTLMHVIETPWVAPSSAQAQDDELEVSELGEYQTQLGRELRQTANTIMENAVRQLEQWSIPATPRIKEGDPALEICSEAEQGGYDLVVAGATGASDIKHAVLGSVSLKLAWDAPCSVAIIRQTVD